MSSKDDFVKVERNKERDISAEYFAMQKLLQKYPSSGAKGSIDREIENLKNDFLAEFAFLEFLLSCDDIINAGKKWDITKIELSKNDMLLLGISDVITQKTFREKTVRIITSYKSEIEEIENSNLTISNSEFPRPNYYVLIFAKAESEIIISGYVNSASLGGRFDGSGRAIIPIGELKNMSGFYREFDESLP